MNVADVCTFCLALPHVEASTPFGPEVLVFKVGGKMFALVSPEDCPPALNLKCDPERALDLRDRHEEILPGYHMNKRHWNTLLLGGKLPGSLLGELIELSYQLVVSSLPGKILKAWEAPLKSEKESCEIGNQAAARHPKSPKSPKRK